MAGPAASVLTPVSATLLSFRDVFARIASEWKGNDFCLISNTTRIGGSYSGESRPFVGGVSDLCEVREFPVFNQEYLDSVQIHFGVICKSNIEVAAMCGSPCDHQVLAEVVASIADEYGGVVSFGGSIACGNDYPTSLKQIHWSEDGEDWFDYCGTSDAVRWWLRHPAFGMVK